jgi:hypothetical protein
MVLVAFRAGLYVAKMANIVENITEASESWTYLAPETSEARAREVLTEFNTSNVRHARLLGTLFED